MREKLINTQQEYDLVATRIEELLDALPGSEEATELKRLTKLIAEFETRNLPFHARLGLLVPKQSASYSIRYTDLSRNFTL